eukprot:TRINITY_DN19710_c0_g1::TRINITY_DN19710_c0_g1_i1::g.3325::m.3325 TRINITY_DN19710_c0_g1::TRINITY_DN19710_c0_g1_i1::g.3325  ORF type:complete len:178 (-),score=31.04,sp/Q54Y03/KAD6_DICDI/57.99/8e-66,AAA_18/PF13238.1/3.6e-31,AAA_17/PF13207.1/2.9e-17,AAA_28/PF13521.1/7e-05,AAA_28/PF13521.1/3.8e+03,AAA/PF00004.24/0.00019,AAA/PF00004.24/3.7e+03,SKI/PF01202.17/0.00046,AAA_33/PF13671.1/0.007,KaiC/PF06745.8/0.0014,KaiC/PF06745.8/5.5e+02,AAA_16/PF13191.1/0.00083,DUF2075/PF09848.4/0.0019,Cytidylate_kin2/PF1
MERRRPNILITGTPGTGKTSLGQQLAERAAMKYINIGDLVKEKGFHEGWDDEYDCYILDEDKTLDDLEELMSAKEGGVIIDHHSCDWFPERWFDLVIVLRTDNTILFDRLKQRGYNEKKLSENLECEIMQVIVDQAKESYTREGAVVELPSNSVDDVESNLERICSWIHQNSMCPPP